jgi:N-methylhydantoinase A
VVESGPAAGVIAAAQLGELTGHRDVIAFDMGGTTAKVSLIQDGQPRVSPEMEVGAAAGGLSGFSGGATTRGRGYPIGTRALDLVEIGAGGGSIAWIDGGGVLRVGPRSAGADPGPACYGRGGIEPTVTDANLVLGRLDAERFLSGEMALDPSAAQAAIRRLSDELGVAPLEAAAGVVANVNASMVRALHLVSTQRGYDPRNFTLVAFGGAGPLHANALAEQLGVRRVLIPRSPGLTSALGLLLSDIEHDLMVTRVQRFGELDYAVLNRVLADFTAQGRAQLANEGVGEDQIELIRSLDLRYVGQSYELEIPLTAAMLDATAEMDLAERFHAEHRRAYGHAAPEEPVELVNLRVRAIGRVPKPRFQPLPPQRGPVDAALRTRRQVFFDALGYTACPAYDRYQLGAGARLEGPAIVEEIDSTAVLNPGYAATVDDYGNLIIGDSG